VSFIWWNLLLFNTFPKKYYSQNLNTNPEGVGIVVLTGGKMRIEKGIDLLARGYGQKLFISGVFKSSNIQTKYSSEEEKKQLFNCCILYGNKATNTLENAYEVNKWLSKNNDIQKILLVSSYYHLPRSLMIFEKKIHRKIKVIPVTAILNNNIQHEPFFHVKLIISEFFKSIYTLIFI
jgi:uncharacterized SAM-binding protein YcdF (DUF218 family)